MRSLTCLLLLVAGCSTVHSASDYDNTAKFTGYTTFALKGRQPASPISAAIQAELQRKGFELVSDPESADFVVDFTQGATARAGVLSIDFFDQRTHRPVWHGWSKEEYSQQTVRDILSWFPPGHTQ